MYISGSIADYDRFRAGLYLRRDSLSLVRKLLLAVSMAVVTGIMAQIRMTLPWTPVPITGQVLAVLMSGVLLGGRLGACSQLLYLTLGAAGIPWFNGFASGPAILLGPTGGYLLGFVPAALLTGRMIELNASWRTYPRLYAVMSAATMLCIYIPGMLQLTLWSSAANGGIPGLGQILLAGAVPFLPGEAVKIALCALAARVIGPPQVCIQRSK